MHACAHKTHSHIPISSKQYMLVIMRQDDPGKYQTITYIHNNTKLHVSTVVLVTCKPVATQPHSSNHDNKNNNRVNYLLLRSTRLTLEGDRRRSGTT